MNNRFEKRIVLHKESAYNGGSSVESMLSVARQNQQYPLEPIRTDQPARLRRLVSFDWLLFCVYFP